MSHGLVEPLQEDDERIVGLSLRLCSHLPRQHQGSQCGQSAVDCRFRLTTVWSVIDASSTTVSLQIRFPGFGWSRAAPPGFELEPAAARPTAWERHWLGKETVNLPQPISQETFQAWLHV